MAVSSSVGSADSDDRSRFERLILENRSRLIKFLSYVYKTRGRDFIDTVAANAESRAWEMFSSFNPERGTFIAWIICMAKHAAVKELKSRHSGLEFSIEGLAESGMVPAVDGPSERYDTAELRRRLWQAVRALPPPVRFPFILYACDDYSIAEIGRKLGKSKTAISYRIDCARRFLSRRLGLGWNGRGSGTDWAKGDEIDGPCDDCAA